MASTVAAVADTTLDSDPGVLMVAGGMMFLLGTFFLRLVIAMVGGLAGATATWHVLGVAMLGDMVDITGQLFFTIVASGFLLGTAIGWRRLGLLSAGLERVVMASALWAVAPEVGAVFGTPTLAMQIGGPLCAALSPRLGLVVLSASAIASGAQLEAPAAMMAVVALTIAMHVLTGGSWLPRVARREKAASLEAQAA